MCSTIHLSVTKALLGTYWTLLLVRSRLERILRVLRVSTGTSVKALSARFRPWRSCFRYIFISTLPFLYRWHLWCESQSAINKDSNHRADHLHLCCHRKRPFHLFQRLFLREKLSKKPTWSVSSSPRNASGSILESCTNSCFDWVAIIGSSSPTSWSSTSSSLSSSIWSPSSSS